MSICFHKKKLFLIYFLLFVVLFLITPHITKAGCEVPCLCPGPNCDRCDTRTCIKDPPVTGVCVSCDLSGQLCWTDDQKKCGGGASKPTPAPSYIIIGGKITNEAGTGIPNVKVHIVNSGGVVVEDVITSSDGRFTSSPNKFTADREYAVYPQMNPDGTRSETPDTYLGLPKSTNNTQSQNSCLNTNQPLNSDKYECQRINGGCGTNCNFKYTSCSSVTFPPMTNASCRVDVAGDGRVDINWAAPTLPSGYSISRYTMATWKGDVAADPQDYTNTYPTDNGKWTKYLCVDHGINKLNTSYSIPNPNASEWARNWPNLPSKTNSWPGRCDWAPLKDNTPAGSVSYRPATYKFADGKAIYTGGIRYVIKDEASGKEVCKTIPNIGSTHFTCTFAPLDTAPPDPPKNVRAEYISSTNSIDFTWAWDKDNTCDNCEERVGRCYANGKAGGPNQVVCDMQTKSPYWWQISNERLPQASSIQVYYYNGNNIKSGLTWTPSENNQEKYSYLCSSNIDEKHDPIRFDVATRDARGNMRMQSGAHPDWPVVQSVRTSCCLGQSIGNANCDTYLGRDPFINTNDYEIWKCEYLQNNGVSSCSLPTADTSKKWSDFDMNGSIDLRDFEIWRQNAVVESENPNGEPL